MATQHYGKSNQVLKLIEELHELSYELLGSLSCQNVAHTNAVYEAKRRVKANLYAIRNISPKLADMTSDATFDMSDEFADCIIMIMQGIDIFDCRDLTQKRIFIKESRLLDRIEGNDKP